MNDNCEKTKEEINDYIDGRLPKERAIIFKKHILVCIGCRSVLDFILKARRVTDSPADEATIDRAWQKIVE